MRRYGLLPATLIAAVALGTASSALADTRDRDADERQDLSAVLNAPTSLSQAIAAAEKEVGGTAVEAGLERQDGVLAYEIEVGSKDSLQTVLVAIDTGKVIKVVPDDREGDEDEDGDAD